MNPDPSGRKVKGVISESCAYVHDKLMSEMYVGLVPRDLHVPCVKYYCLRASLLEIL